MPEPAACTVAGGQRTLAPPVRSPRDRQQVASGADLYYAVETALIAPGIGSHEAAHLLACRVAGVDVLGSSIPNPCAGDASLDHEPVSSFPAALLIAVAPVLLYTTLVLAAFVLVSAGETPLLSIPCYWLGVCSGLAAFPSVGDIETLFQTAGDPLARPDQSAICSPRRYERSPSSPTLRASPGSPWAWSCSERRNPEFGRPAGRLLRRLGR